jgi:hypothetical protein
MSKVHIAKPPKPVKEMTDEEKDQWLEEVWETLERDRKHP